MNMTKTAFGLSFTVCLALLAHACQPEPIQDHRSATTGRTAQPASGADDANSNGNNTNTQVPPANTGTTATPAAPANYTMTWDVPADAAIVSYKVFLVPSDQNPRFPGKTDVPIQIKNYPLAELQKNGQKYSVVVSSDQIKTALGTTPAPATKCFSIVAVNGVGNSSYSPVICP